MRYPELPDELIALEEETLARWREEDLFRQTLDATESGEPFVFFEGPPTANGRPGIHHVISRTIKDLVCRFRTMEGRSVTRIAGWDTHGLPVEIEAEKRLGISGKPEIEALGIAATGTVGFGLSIDLDALDPADAPGVGSKVAGGIRSHDLVAALVGLGRVPSFLGAEIVEYNPALDAGGVTAEVVRHLLAAIYPQEKSHERIY